MKLLWLLLVACVVSCGAPLPPQPSQAERREAAYRANNRGVAMLEQFQHEQAAAAFREALQLDPVLRLAHINLPIALFYAGRAPEAAREAAAARDRFPDAPQPPYLIGLIDRSENRLDSAVQAFQRVLQLDPDDVGAKVNLALVYMQQQRYQDVVALCESALAAESYNATAAYNLGLALSRLGDARAPAALARFEALRSAAYAITYSQTYLEQGRYAEALTSTGAEPDLVNQGPSAVTFVDATPALPPAAAGGGGVALADLDADGDLDLVEAGAPLRVLRNDWPAFTDITRDLGLAAVGTAVRGAAAGDFNNDTRTDLLLVGSTGARLFARQDQGGFRELGRRAFPAEGTQPVPSAAFADVDHDGDLDVVLGGTAARLLRNNGNGTFTDITRAAALQSATAVSAIAPGDFDNRRDADLFMLSRSAAPKLFRNLRTGTFADVAASSGLPGAGAYAAVAVGDVNKDGFVDLFLGRDATVGMWAISDGRGRFRTDAGPDGTVDVTAALLIDYDNDGLLDLITAGARGARAFRNLGRTWPEEDARFFPADLERPLGLVALAAGDLDLDGDTDLAAHLPTGGLRIWRNDGGSRNRGLRVRLQGRVSNRQAVGAKVEVRAGSLFQKLETTATTPPVTQADVVFGLGSRQEADVVRVLWPAGILQTETVLSGPARTAAGLAILELDRKPSSCPYLYTWNGSEFEFVTDFMGGGEIGYWHAPGIWNVPDPTEYVRITDTQLQPRGGRLELRVTNELEEVLFVDHLGLMAVTHPADVLVFPNEGLRSSERPFRLFAVRDARPPARAHDEHGHDLLQRISRMDRQYPDDFERLPVRGYAAEHIVTIDVPADVDGTSAVLLLTGWTDYAFSSDNVAAHQAGLTLSPPILQAKDATGRWHTVDADVGIPVGRPQTLALDLASALSRGHQLRLITNMRVYWDQILVATAAPPPRESVWLPRMRASLGWRGFSAEATLDGREPIGYDYHRVLPTSPWKLMPGRYTREGDAEELVRHIDDRFVISRPGDELTLSFDAAGLPALPAGLRRTYLLYAVGYSKEMDVHSASPDQAAPIPFRAMSRYPYASPERYPHTEDLDHLHTRVITRSIGSLLR